MVICYHSCSEKGTGLECITNSKFIISCGMVILTVFSIGCKVDFGAWEVYVAEANCQQHFAKTANLTVRSSRHCIIG